MARFSKMALVLLAAASTVVPRGGALRAAEEHRTITVTAKRFEFSPRLITVKVGETVTLELTSEDVTHGLFSKPLGIDVVIAPGKPSEATFTPVAAGSYTTICDHFCGAGHGGMKMTIVVE